MVYKHGKTWRYQFKKNGIVHRQSGFKKKTDAVLAEAKVQKGLSRITATGMDFINLCGKRLDNIQINRSEKYYRDNKRLFEKLIVRWGKKKRIHRDDVEVYLNTIARQSKNSANYTLRLIKSLFNYGIKRGWIDDNPAVGIEQYSVSKEPRYIPPKEDILKVLSEANPEQRSYLLVITFTMARSSEVNRLTWADINFDEGWLYLRTYKARNSSLKLRKYPLNKPLVDVLESIPKEHEHVFFHPRLRKPYVYRKKMMKSLCHRAGVKAYGFHALRHYGATLLDSRGVPLTVIQELLGHEKATTTAIYLQTIQGEAKRAVTYLEMEGVEE